jgi:hypothetical protein
MQDAGTISHVPALFFLYTLYVDVTTHVVPSYPIEAWAILYPSTLSYTHEGFVGVHFQKVLSGFTPT